MALSARLGHRSLVVVCGKGGVGKTTVSAAVALALAAEGRRVLVAEVAAKDDVARTLAGAGSVGTYRERVIAQHVGHVSIDPRHAMDEYLRTHLPLGVLAGLLPRRRLFALVTAATPGLAELLTIGKVWELARDAAHDVVVLDAPATGHALALLQAPRTFAAAVGRGPAGVQAGVIDAFLRDPAQTAVLLVTTAEELPVNETVSLRDRLAADLGATVDEVVVNAVYPDRFTRAEVRALDAAPPSPARHAARFAAERALLHRAQVRRLRRGLGPDVGLRTLPFVFEAPSIPAALVPELAA